MRQNLTVNNEFSGFEDLFNKYIQFRKKVVDLYGPTVDELINKGIIKSPYPHLVRKIKLNSRATSVFFVLIPISDINKENLFEDENSILCPTLEEVLRFASQTTRKNPDVRDISEGTCIVFPTDPSFIDDTVKPPAENLWWVLLWRADKGYSELVLFDSMRNNWPKNALFAGVVADSRQE